MMSYLVGTALCGLTLAFGPLLIVVGIDASLVDFYHRVVSWPLGWFVPLWTLWAFSLIVLAVFDVGRRFNL